MPDRTVVLIHGYSDRGESFNKWRAALEVRGFKTAVCSYESLVNEVSIKDIAEGFDRALRIQAGLSDGEPFDAIVHSTGMLVLRAWLTTYAPRRDRLKHLVGLAPATFGSPLAHKGRSWLGAIFKGRRELGPDFLEAGDLVLDGLELGSQYTWDLAHLDLLGDEPFYGKDKRTPYVFVFVGNKGYGGAASLVNPTGSDGTVRWAAVALTTRKIILDLTDEAQEHGSIAPWSHLDAPMVPVDGVNHGTILSEPPHTLIDFVARALAVSTEDQFNTWNAEAASWSRPARESMDRWQQFVVRAVDERGDPIPDYHLQLLTSDGKKVKPFDTDVHAYERDKSFRCFHVNLTKLGDTAKARLQARIIASSGSQLVGYHGVGSEKIPVAGAAPGDGKWDAQVDLAPVIGEKDEKVRFFFPYTTTLVELRLNREPLPLTGTNKVAWFLP